MPDSEKNTPAETALLQQTQSYDLPEPSPVVRPFLPFRRWTMVLLTVGICLSIGFALFRHDDGNKGGQGAGSTTVLQQTEKNVAASEGQKNGVEEMPAAAEAVGATTSLPLAMQPEGDGAALKQPDNSDNEVQALLAQAERAEGDNSSKKQALVAALEAYRQVLVKDPGNGDAQRGVQRIGDHYGTLAEQALRADRFAEAAAYLQKGLSATPGSARLQGLQARLVEQKKEAIRILAGKAEAALQKDHLTSPEGECAHKYYSEILQLDGNSPLAIAGMQKIADRYAVLAEESYRNLNIAQCREYVRQGLTIAPQHRQLLQLRRDLTRSKPGMFFKSLEKSFKPIFQ
jgi:hypothetical protein